MDIGPIVRVLEDVPATIPVEREPAGAPVPREPQPLEPADPRGTATLLPTARAQREDPAEGARA